ncbi:serine-rich adhesin for platelets-like isoform X2 [Montipora foliosa]|uniref:serine-rich adhesin for platelets-like isoform X2 n=1 Tax=Montipora foliosa TaxID=591990 RepID=UPI0035F1DFD9
MFLIMEQPTVELKPSSQSRAGQLPTNKRLHDIEQEYLEQWHLLENLGSSMEAASGMRPIGGEDLASSQPSGTGDVHEQGTKLNDDEQEKEGSAQWFVLGEESLDDRGTGTPSEDQQMAHPGVSNSDQTLEGENITQLSPYAEQWHELEQLKESVRSLSHAAGLLQSPHLPPEDDETLASGLSSGSLSVEALDEVGVLEAQVVPQDGTVQEGVAPLSLEQEAVEDDSADSGASFSVHDSGIDEKQLRNEWFPLRPSAVGEDDEDTIQMPYATGQASHGANNVRLQNVPHVWSDEDGKQSPPERSQPDGRDGPDLKRMPWISTTYGSTPQVISAPAQSQPVASVVHTSKDSESDVSLASQPHSLHNETPLEIITRSVPPVKKGVNLMSELRQRHAPQLNSDSDTESPVSKLLGPNFRAVQEVLDRLKRDRLTDKVGEEAKNAGSDGGSMTKDYVEYMSSAAALSNSAGSRDYGMEWTSGRPVTARKSSSETDAVVWPKAVSPRFPPSHRKGHTVYRPSQDESLRSFSENDITNVIRPLDSRQQSSWTSAKVSSLHPSEITPVDTIPKTPLQATNKYPIELSLLSSSSALDPLTPGEMLDDAGYGGHKVRSSLDSADAFPLAANSGANLLTRDYSVVVATSEDVLHRHLRSDTFGPTLPQAILPSSGTHLQAPSSRSSIASSIKSSRIAWGGETPPATRDPIQRAPNQVLPRVSVESSVPALGADSGLSLSTSRERPNRIETEESFSVIPADNFPLSGHTSSVIDGTEAAPISIGDAREGTKDSSPLGNDQGKVPQSGGNLPRLGDNERMPYSGDTYGTIPAPDTISAASVATAKEESNGFFRTGQDQGKALLSGNGLENLRESDTSASSDDTDDLLNYEPVLEGNRQYLRMQKHAQSKQLDSGAVNNRENRILVKSSRDLPMGDTVKRMSDQEQSSSTLQGQYDSHSEVNDTHIKSLHWSLGAGTISPISETILAQRDSKQGKSSTPLGSVSERSSMEESEFLQEQSLENDTLVDVEGRDVVATKQVPSRSTTDFSSSDEIYKPVLHRDASGNKENHPNESVFQTSSYGIYDIRRSSGPGSTNRRRKAMGLEPNPAREVSSQNGPGMVYISGSSTPSSSHDSVGRASKDIGGLAGRRTGHRNVQLEQDNYEESLESNEEKVRPRRREPRDSRVLKGRQAQDFRDRYHDAHALREKESERHRARAVKDSSQNHRTPTKLITSERSSHSVRKTVDETEENPSKKLASLAKSRRRATGDSDGTSSNNSTADRKARTSRKHSDAKTGSRSRDKTDRHAVKPSRLDANISKLSSLVSKSMDESASSSSRASVIQSQKWPISKSSKRRMTSSSESSDVSEFFNYAFMEPRLRSSMKHKIRIRELLKSVKAQDISPIIRVRDSTSTESATNTSINGEKGKETGTERENVELNEGTEEPSPDLLHTRRPEAFTVPFSDPTYVDREPKCTCRASQTRVVHATLPAKSRKVERKGYGKEFRLPRKRDVGVNCPTPIITRSPAASSDESLHGQFEDAGTQTEEFVGQRKANSKDKVEPYKSPSKGAKSPLRNKEERGVISQPSPKTSDYVYNVDHREAVRYKPKERLIPSQNSPDHSVKTTSDRSSRAQVPAWFHPVTSKAQTEPKALSELKTPSKSRSNDELRVDVFDAAVNSSSSLQKLSLQEAFLYAKSSFVKRSTERVARIEQAAREKDRRKLMEEAAAEERRIEASKRTSPPDTPKIKTRVKGSDQLYVPKPRQMTKAEMKELNQRLYKNLPEVKAKHEKMRRQAFYRTNRLRAQLYDKRVRTRLKGAGK